MLKRAKKEKQKKYRNRAFRKKRISQKPKLRSYKYQKRFQKESESNFLGVVDAEPSFTILEDIRNVLKFVSSLKDYAHESNARKTVYLNLKRIEKIDIGAICMILSTVEELSQYSVFVRTNVPENKECREQIIDANFIPHLKRLSYDKVTGEPRKRSLILKVGTHKSKNSEVGGIVREAMEMLTGEKKHYPPIYSIIQEINGNSVEHAYECRDHWMLGINHDRAKKKVIFTFSDNGFGILKTLRRRLGQHFFDELQLKDNPDILKGAFNKKYSSRHVKQFNRNKGLPLLKKIQGKGQVKNLLVITNDVYLRIEDEYSIPLHVNFSGTYYYWELDSECLTA